MADTGFTFTQSTPAAVWVVDHNLNKEVSSDVFINDAGGMEKILPLSVESVSENQLKITFSSPQTGFARLM